MRRAALALLLCFSIPVLLLAQHHAAEGGSSASSSAGSGGYSSSGGPSTYTGSSSGSSHSSTSSSSSSSSSSSGSHSGEYGGSSNTYHSSSAEPSSGHSNPHSSGSSSSHPSSINSGSTSNFDMTHSGSRSDLREAAPDLAQRTYLGNFAFSPQVSPQLVSLGITNDSLQQPVTLHSGMGLANDPNKALRTGGFDAELQKLGIARSRADFERKAFLPASGSREPQHQSWLNRLFFEKNSAASDPDLRPCKLKECKPIPTPPRPNPRPQPSPQPVSNVCLSGVPDPLNASGCVPWGYVESCSNRQGCNVHLSPVNYRYCDAILARMKAKADQVADLERVQSNSCSSHPQSFECAAATCDYNTELATLDQLKTQYQVCRMSVLSNPNLAGVWDPLVQ